MDIRALTECPNYLAGAFFSQSHNLVSSQQRAQKQETCFLATIATFIKKSGATCFASPETILATYNKHAHKFDLKPIGRSTLFTIQSRVIKSGLITNVLVHDQQKGRNWRKFSLNIPAIAERFHSVAKLAYHRANSLLNRVLDSNRSQKNTTKESSRGAGSHVMAHSEKWTRKTNQSKDLSNKNKTPGSAFFKTRFKEDCDLAYQLQEQARAGSIQASGAKKLISLHYRHGVMLAPTFKAYLTQVILNAPKQQATESRSQATEAQLSAQRLKATIRREKAEEAARAQHSAPKPEHMCDTQHLERGMQLLNKIRNRNIAGAIQ